MAELVDALVSGTSIRKDVQVRVLFWAQLHLAQMVKLVDTPAWGAGARKGVQVRVLFWALTLFPNSSVIGNLQSFK